MKFKLLASAILLCIGTQQAYAWGQTGHRITGKLAENYLSDEARIWVMEILPNESLAEASTYADEMRSSPDEFWQKVAGPYHYVSVPKGKKYVEVGSPPNGDAVSALNSFTSTLKDPKASLEAKQLALRFAIHIIGDLHQPLHAGNGTDRGGNDVKLEFFWEDSNLHRVWDSGLLDRRKLSFSEWSEWLGKKITPEDVSKWTTTDPTVYIEESIAIRDTIYPDGDKLSWQYLYDHLPTAKQRLKMAGVRIAAYLNEIAAEK
ncbi:S1/P1 nuclease [Agaribacter marinus]|uniref:Endonuclease n=1 Tax=Agaribacter marinus TaxID=1431249 RepID=A0AA37WGW5_9ALTE|nr:S1/P1 nuclease [Agaribacter marinus]GLR69198.1 endonuclease [Agaribacter marinus]